MNILAFFAHPDDETMLCGGTLALLAAKGHSVHYLCATRGEGGEVGEPPVCDREVLGEVRAHELACAVQKLGGKSLVFLNYVDPLVGPGDTLYSFTDDICRLAEELLDTLRLVKADVLITHGSNGEYGHPAHKTVYSAAQLCLAMLGSDSPIWYTVQASYANHPKPRLMNRDDPADMILNIQPVFEQKSSAALCHVTQHALFVRRASEESGRNLSVSEVVMMEESFHRVWPVSKNGKTDMLAAELQRSGCIIED